MIRLAKENAVVVLDEFTGEPRMVVTDASPAYRAELEAMPDHTVIDVPVDVYNESITNPDGAHIDVIDYALEKAAEIA